MTKSFNSVVPIMLTVIALVVITPTDFLLAVCYIALFCADVPSPPSCP
jgi:hypothetical protein